MQGSAVLSADGRYRYLLTRRWAAGPALVAVLLNPGSADAGTDDPTVRRCLGFARAADCAALQLLSGTPEGCR